MYIECLFYNVNNNKYFELTFGCISPHITNKCEHMIFYNKTKIASHFKCIDVAGILCMKFHIHRSVEVHLFVECISL